MTTDEAIAPRVGAPALEHLPYWSHGDLAVIFPSSKPEFTRLWRAPEY